MKIDSVNFCRELLSWSILGVLCAVPSAYWAFAVKFEQPVEWAAMSFGVMVWVVAVAWFSSCGAMHGSKLRRKFLWTLKMSAGIKAGLLLVAGLAWFFGSGLYPNLSPWFVCGVLPDFWAGFISLWLVNLLAGSTGGLDLGQLNSFGWTLATTVVQGALITLLIMLVAQFLLGTLWLWARFKPAVFAGSA